MVQENQANGKNAEPVTKTIVEVANVPTEAVTIIFVDMPRESIAKSGKLLSN